MLREPHSLYKVGRSESLRKFKPFFDTEVKVLENNYPHGFNCVQYEIMLAHATNCFLERMANTYLWA